MMKTTLTALRKKLSGKLSEDDLYEICYYAQGIGDNPTNLALYRLLYDNDKRIANNAAWVFTHFDLHSNQWLYDKHDALIDEAMQTTDQTKRRLLLSLLLRQPFSSENFRADFLNFCLDCITAIHASISIKSLCMKLAYEQCKPYPELLDELRNILELMEMELLPAGVKTTRKNMLKLL